MAKKPDPSDITRPRPGFLACDECGRSIPYQGLPNMNFDEAPKHKCRNYAVKPFQRWTLDDPWRPPLSKAVETPTEQETAHE